MADHEKLANFGSPEEPVSFVETMAIKEGVECDVYSFDKDRAKDLAIVRVAPGFKTPLQKVLLGTTTTEGHISGAGTLTIQSPDGRVDVFRFDGQDQGEILVEVGQIMQWSAGPKDELLFYEVCVPPYEDGRFEDIPE